jgi:hypothetical protein
MKPHIKGMLAGWALWAVLFAIGYLYLTGPNFLPKDSAVFGYVGFAAAVAALPIAWGGWVFIWGDGPGQPPAFATTMWFTVVFGLALYGFLGAIAGAMVARLRNTRQPP